MILRIAYVSRAAQGVTERDAFDIIRVAHNRNRQHDLSGGLVFIDGHFVQVLEGMPFRVRDRFDRIVCDPRHSDVDLRLEVQPRERLFEGEWMALRCAHEIDAGVLNAHGYVPGLPTSRFDGDAVVGFVRACCLAGAVA